MMAVRQGSAGAAPWEARAAGEPDDATLVAAARLDRRAFGPLYDRYVRAIYRYCYARLGSREAAEDATSEIFLRALAALGRYRDRAFAAWLFRIAHNVTVDLLRRHHPALPLTAAAATPDPARAPDERALARTEREAVRAALAALPPEQRDGGVAASRLVRPADRCGARSQSRRREDAPAAGERATTETLAPSGR